MLFVDFMVDSWVLFHRLPTCRFLSTDLCVGKSPRKHNICTAFPQLMNIQFILNVVNLLANTDICKAFFGDFFN